MRHLFLIATLCIYATCSAQFSFSGYVNQDEWNNTVYLSLVEDYRKLTGIYNEQIIAKVETDSTGYFEFKGNMLDEANRIYRIHVDKCAETLQDANHFNGHCDNSKTLIFIANNNDTLELPFSFENQVFCDIQSTNPKANAFVKIDSLKADMRFAYSEIRSEASKKLNNKKWFKTLQEFGKNLNEPLAELYIYSYLSDRTSELHSYYIKDLKKNSYYDELQSRLDTKYTNANYTMQYRNELASDKYMLQTVAASSSSNWHYLLYGLLVVSLFLNGVLFFKIWSQKKVTESNLKARLSKQENVVLDQLLQGKSNKAIAEALFLSVSTVKTHTNNIYKKLEVQSRDDVKSLFSK